MNTELFIARRLFSSTDQSRHLSRRIVRLAVAGISLGMAVMILAVAIVVGFQKEVESKVNGFAAHLQIVNGDHHQSYQTGPVEKEQVPLARLAAIPGIRHIQQVATKPGMIKAGDEIQGVVLKGIAKDFDWSFFEKNKVKGTQIPLDSGRSGQIWISEQLSARLKLGLGEKFRMYFLNDDERTPRIRQFTVGGIYRTGLEEFDLMFVLVDIRHVQRLNSWNDNQVSGYELFLHNRDQLDDLEFRVRHEVATAQQEKKPFLQVVNVKHKFPQIFDWLNLLDMNVWVILALMILVAGFNMISGLLVIILERTQMIGILKSLGAANAGIRKVFLYLSALLVGEGLLWGNLLGVSLCLAQYYFKVVHLDPTSYYVSTVPVSLSLTHLLLLNLGALSVTLLMLIAPSWIVSRIAPEKTIRFD
ncbi:MAG: ABC transporter permease [Mangrovibacterium sp.]|nr:ABC transporter permease [Mangrovibacterium sp.]